MSLAILAFVAALGGYLAFQVIHRLVLHPLKRFPGPRLAALTEYYRAYYDVFCNGGWMYHLADLHRVYGPIIRVGPNELHFSDPDAFDEIHVTNKCIKDKNFYNALMTPHAVVATFDHQEAVRKRAKLAPYFSRKSVLEMEGLVQQTIDTLISRLSSYASGQAPSPANLSFAYRATTVDIISSYCFSQDFKALFALDFHHPHLSGMDQALQAAFTFKWIPGAQWALMHMPPRLMEILAPATKPQIEQTKFIEDKVDYFTANAYPGDEKAVFDVWLRSGAGDKDKNQYQNPWTVPREEVIDECMSLHVAGSDTVGNACMIGTYHLLRNPEVLKKLKEELDEAWPEIDSGMKLETLEVLPYLTAVIKESLRLSHGVISPLPRVTGPDGASISGEFVPPNTAVGCGPYIVHTNPSVFKDPMSFIPERWLESNPPDKYLVAFSKGPRLCLGSKLAWCELYLIFANVFRKLDMTIHDTTDEDLRFSDYFVPVYTRKPLTAIVKVREA